MSVNIEAIHKQIDTTINHLERGEILREDRVFLNHILETVTDLLVAIKTGDALSVQDSAFELVGSTAELLEDGLLQDFA